MLQILSQVYTIFSTIIIIGIIYQLLGIKIKYRKAILIIALIVVILWIITSQFIITGIMRKNIYMLIIVGVLTLFKVSSLFQLFVCTVITINTIIMINDIFLNSLVTYKNIATSTLYYNPLAYSLVSIFFLVFQLIILVFLKFFKMSLFEGQVMFYSEKINNKFRYINIIFNRYKMIIVVIVAQMWLLTMYFQINDSTSLKISSEVHSVQQDSITLIVSLVIIILNIIVIFMIKNILVSEKEQYQYKIKEKEFANIQQQDKIIRQYKHDITNHFEVLNILATNNKIEELKNYLTNYNEDFNSNLILVNSGLEELDILINSKVNIAQMKNITVKYNCLAEIKCEKRHIINLISIVGNVLDNAIEASEKSERKLLKIEIRDGSLDYVLIIKNTMENNKLPKSDILLQEGYSTKGQDRGFGLQIVNKLVKKYNGNFEIINEEDIFVIKIDLPKHELEKI